MTAAFRLALLAAVALTLVALSSPGAAQAPTSGYIVVLQPGSDAPAEAAKAAKEHGIAVSHVYEHALTGFAFHGSAQAVEAIKRNPNVAYVSPDFEVSIAGQPGSDGPTIQAESVPTGVSRIGGPAGGTGTGVGVAIIDTGIQLDHPDLGGVVSGKNCVRTRRLAADDHGHGTHVAGTIGGRDNDIGVLGVAPAAKLYAVKVLNSQGSGTWSQVICGIDWVTANAATIKVANMSLGGGGSATASDPVTCKNTNSDALHEAICKSVKAGITYAVAAGNSSANAAGFVPAAYDEVIAVSALADFNGLPGGGAAATCRADVDDTFADFSNFGAVVDIAAPGVCILSTWKGSSYNTISGTSMASPHVAGAAALEIAKNGGSPAQVKAALVAAADQTMTGDPDSTHEGVLDISGY